LTFRTRARLNFLVRTLKKWAKDKRTFGTVVFDDTKLWHDTRTACDYPTGTDQLIDMKLPGIQTK
jgi:hypothetical protein